MNPTFHLIDNENFASIVLTNYKIPLKIFPSDIHIKPFRIGQNLWISMDSPLVLDDMWRNWIGGIISDRIENGPGRIVFTAKSIEPNETPESLMLLISNVFWGLAIVAGIPHFDTGDTIYGQYNSDILKGKSGIKIGFGFRRVYTNRLLELLKNQSCTELTQGEFDQALIFSERIVSIVKMIKQKNIDEKIFFEKSITDFYTRILSGYEALQAGMTSFLPMERLHQFVRAMEAFLPTDVKGSNAFIEYLIKLISNHSNNKDVLKQIYNLRNAQEHHLPFNKKALADEKDYDKLAWTRLRQTESLAREFFRRFMADRENYLHHFVDEVSLKNFWENGEAIRIWGNPFDIQSVQQ